MRKLLFFLYFFTFFLPLKAQFPYGTTGLLHMPTAEMQSDKTFMAGASFLNSHATPPYWSYNNYNYYINITFLPFLEVGYTCTLNKGMPGGYWPKKTWGKFVNQDRQFSVRIRLIKEKQFWEYMPSIVVGGNDILTRDWFGEGNEGKEGIGWVAAAGNGMWNRYYLAMSKHISWAQAGDLGVHLAYVYNRRKRYHLNGICIGTDFRPLFHKQIQIMAEYDSRTINLGLSYAIWKDHINLVAELNQCKYLSAGIYFKVHLK